MPRRFEQPAPSAQDFLLPKEKALVDRIKTPRILSWHEMALAMKDDAGKHYVGELGNPSRRDKSDRFFYAPGKGLVIAKEAHDNVNNVSEIRDANTLALSEDDMVVLNVGDLNFGHVRLKDFFKSEERLYSDVEFSRLFSEHAEDGRRKFEKIWALASKMRFSEHARRVYASSDDLAEAAIRSFYRAKERSPDPSGQTLAYTKKELLIAAAQILKEEMTESEQERWSEVLNNLEKEGVFDDRLDTDKASIVDYFYEWVRAHRISIETGEKTLQALERFPFIRDIMDEFERAPDARFGDQLLVALSELEERSKKEV